MISPCVAFNNHEGSTKSFDYVREHNEAVNFLDVITGREEITVQYEPGTVEIVRQHDGTLLKLRKISARIRRTRSRCGDGLPATAANRGRDRHRPAVRRLRTRKICTRHLRTVETPFNALADEALVPGAAALEKLNATLR